MPSLFNASAIALQKQVLICVVETVESRQEHLSVVIARAMLNEESSSWRWSSTECRTKLPKRSLSAQRCKRVTRIALVSGLTPSYRNSSSKHKCADSIGSTLEEICTWGREGEARCWIRILVRPLRHLAWQYLLLMHAQILEVRRLEVATFFVFSFHSDYTTLSSV